MPASNHLPMDYLEAVKGTAAVTEQDGNYHTIKTEGEGWCVQTTKHITNTSSFSPSKCLILQVLLCVLH